MTEDSIQPVVMAGGSSRRFGSDKTLHVWQGKALVDHAIDVLRFVIPTGEVWLTVDRLASRTRLVAHIQDKHGDVVFFEDDPKLVGPMAGLSSSLLWARRRNIDWIYVLASDMPGTTPDFAQALVARRQHCPTSTFGLVPRPALGGARAYQPLQALYRPGPAFESLARWADTGRRDLQGWIESESGGFDVLDNPELEELSGQWRRSLTNINHREELDALQEML